MIKSHFQGHQEKIKFIDLFYGISERLFFAVLLFDQFNYLVLILDLFLIL